MGTKIDAGTIAKPFRDEVKAAVQRLKDSGLGMSISLIYIFLIFKYYISISFS